MALGSLVNRRASLGHVTTSCQVMSATGDLAAAQSLSSHSFVMKGCGSRGHDVLLSTALSTRAVENMNRVTVEKCDPARRFRRRTPLRFVL